MINTIKTIGCMLVLFALLTACKKDNYSLPPETQTGAGTFGCKIDGKVWVPKGSDGNSGQNKKAFYQYIYPSPTGYVFHVGASNYERDPLEGISISTDSVKLLQGVIINLGNKEKGKIGLGEFHTIGSGVIKDYSTTEIYKGQLILTRFDETNLIVSVVFWFDAQSNEGEIIHVTDGRFDMKYTR